MADVKVNRETSERGKTAGGTTTQNESSSGSLTRRGYEPMPFSRYGGDLFSMSPFALMRHLTEEMDRHFGMWSSQGGGLSMWAPPIEVKEREGNLVVCAELPGLNKDDVKVDVTDGVLTIQGERKREHEENREGVRRSERSYGHFYRAIQLPENAEIDKAKAKFDNGVLEVMIPAPEPKTNRREIPIEGMSSKSGSQTLSGSSSQTSGSQGNR